MSLLIEGMDMPKDCASCDLSYYCDGYNGGYGYGPSGFMCRRLKRLIKEDEKNRNYYPRPSDCPLSEIPTPHGRLIDADRLIVALKNSVHENPSFLAPLITISQIERQTTIIEAEGNT